MTKALPMVLCLFALLPAACERNFDSPPDQAWIESFDPEEGFTDDLVVICGRNLGVDESTTTVRFGTMLAEVAEDDPALAPDCAYERLAVLVPEVSDPEEVDLVVSSTAGQATAAGQFDFLGPGHPPEDVVSGEVRIRSRPYNLAARRIPMPPDPETGEEQAIDVMVAACFDSSLIQMIESSESVSFGFGTLDPPIAAEVALGEIAFFPDRVELGFSVLATLITVDQEDSLLVEPRLERKAAQFVIGVQGERLELEMGQPVLLPEASPLVDGSRLPVLPWRMWSGYHTSECVDLDVLVSHAAAPILWVLPGGLDAGSFAVGAAAGADPDACHPLGTPVDVALFQGPDHLTAYTTFATDADEMGDGLWAVDLVDGSLAERVGPADFLSGDDQCGDLAILSVAVRRLASDQDELRVYAADELTQAIHEFAWTSTGLGDRLVATGRVVPLPGEVMDMATGRFAWLDPAGQVGAGEHLYAATEEGLFVIDISDPGDPWNGPASPLEVVDRIDLGPDVLATPISFSVIDAFIPGSPGVPPDEPPVEPSGTDRIFFANAGDDRWVGFEAGFEQVSLTSQPIVTSLPEVAASRLLDGVYLADATVDVLRVVERRSGVQCLQVPIEGKSGFSQGYMATAHGEDRDVVLVALPAPESAANVLGFQEFDRVVPIIFTPGDGGACDLDFVYGSTVPVEPFHQMFVLRNGSQHTLQYNHFGDEEVPRGAKRRCRLDLSLDANEIVVQAEADPARICQDGEDLPPSLLAMRVSPRHQIAAHLAFAGQGIFVGVQEQLVEDSPVMDYRISDQTANFFMDLIAVRLGSPGRIGYLVAIPLGALGQVQLAYLEPDGAGGFTTHERLLPVGGLPEAVYASPDERQLYFVNPAEDLITIVDLDCEDLPGCIQVEQTREVGEMPFGVTFSDTGEVGYVTHLFGSVLSVIE